MRKDRSGIIIFIIMTVLFMVFLSLTFFLLLFDFSNNETLTVSLKNIFGKEELFEDSNFYFKSLAAIPAIAAINYFGFLAFKNNRKLTGIGWTVFLGLIYAVLLGLILYFSWTLQVKYLFNGNILNWFNAFTGVYWVCSVVFALISLAGYVLIKLLGWGDYVHIVFYFLIPILFPIAFIAICWFIVERITGKIEFNPNFSSSNGSSEGKTYTYTNSMGCTSTVVSDNGKDFYNPCSGAYEGSSDDGGNTINPN